MDTCATCRFFDDREHNLGGICKRYPPTVTLDVDKMIDQASPHMAHDDWCGEYQPQAALLKPVIDANGWPVPQVPSKNADTTVNDVTPAMLAAGAEAVNKHLPAASTLYDTGECMNACVQIFNAMQFVRFKDPDETAPKLPLEKR